METKHDDVFINQLIKETYEALDGNDVSQSSSNLFDYFQEQQKISSSSDLEKRVIAFFECNNLDFFHMNFNRKTSCFSFEIKLLKFDLPMNMKCFDNLSIDDYIHCNESSDVDLVNSIFSEVTEAIVETIFININGRYMLLLLENANNELMIEIEKIFLKKVLNAA